MGRAYSPRLGLAPFPDYSSPLKRAIDFLDNLSERPSSRGDLKRGIYLSLVMLSTISDRERISSERPSHNEIKKRCFLGRVEHGLALCHSYKRSPIQDWKKCYMRTSRSNRIYFFRDLVSHLFLRNKREK